jgi:hypothetical protein
MENNRPKMILEFSKCKIPILESEVKTFLIDRIKSGKSLLKFFGKELDGSIECNEGEFLSQLEESTFVRLYFNDEDTASINYKTDKEHIFKLMLSVLEKNDITQIGVDGKNIDIRIARWEKL